MKNSDRKKLPWTSLNAAKVVSSEKVYLDEWADTYRQSVDATVEGAIEFDSLKQRLCPDNNAIKFVASFRQ